MILRIALEHPEQGIPAFFSEGWSWDEWVIKVRHREDSKQRLLQQLLSELSDYRKVLRRHVKAETEEKFYKDLEEIPS